MLGLVYILYTLLNHKIYILQDPGPQRLNNFPEVTRLLRGAPQLTPKQLCP